MSKQREIKFRAWVDKDFIFGGSNKGRMYTGFYFESIYAGRDESNVYCDDDTIWAEPQWGDAKIMQYTGLRDKNGAEIYEGDIVECVEKEMFNKRKNHQKFISPVYWEDLSWTVRESEMCEAPLCVYDNSNPTKLPVTTIRVIGNIFENPKLLEAK